MTRKIFTIIIPASLFLLGCTLHYLRGYYFIGVNSVHAQGVDDAYISFRYGWNLANFGTLSWNESGYRLTEGFTNPLWVYLSALWAFLVEKQWIYPAIAITSAVVTATLLLLLIHSTSRIHERSVYAVVGLLFIAITPSIWLHTTSGLESSVFGIGLAYLAFLAIFTYRKEQPPIFLIFFSVLLGLLRSDAFIYLAIITIAALIAESRAWKFLLWGLLVSIILILVWRQISFGGWLPNTAIAKVNFGLGERVPVGFSILIGSVVLSGLFVILLLGFAGLFLEHKRVTLAGLFIMIGWVIYYIYIGGDTFMERHLIGLFALAAAFSAPLWARASFPARGILVIAVLAGISLSVIRDMGRFDYLKPKKNDPWVMLGQEIAQDRESYGVLITSAAGKIPFYAGGECIDTYGLNDPYLATFRRESFKPGHSSGNDLAALDLARSHPSGVYSIFSYFDTDTIGGPESVRLWVDNRNPQESVQQGVTREQWNAALATNDFLIWSIISKPTIANQ